MAEKIMKQRYAPVSIVLHWAMLLLITGGYACILLRGYFPRGSDLREGLKTWHFMLGLSVLLLAVIRIAARLLTARPPITPQPPAWQIQMSTGVHWALYAFMLVMPLLGWTILSAEEKTIPFYGLHLFPLVAPSKALATQVQEVHETIGTIGYFLIGLHAAAALLHHYYYKDDTLKRMLPGNRSA
ncbi:cytochrome b561 [Blastomonas natatoria]|uniref:Cytochrome b561 n=1 Tax=Blastomonas natatoria TaxID=34015 RepID=A0A2V3V8M0_9SPHN|nr:cytochrome b [Blastomonas natatoria]PXW77514.1 cytochrome b561 [Blastomonas natatoria]